MDDVVVTSLVPRLSLVAYEREPGDEAKWSRDESVSIAIYSQFVAIIDTARRCQQTLGNDNTLKHHHRSTCTSATLKFERPPPEFSSQIHQPSRGWAGSRKARVRCRYCTGCSIVQCTLIWQCTYTNSRATPHQKGWSSGLQARLPEIITQACALVYPVLATPLKSASSSNF